MTHDHGAAGHSHDHTAGSNAKMLGWALALTSVYLVAEVIGGFVFRQREQQIRLFASRRRYDRKRLQLAMTWQSSK